MTQENQQKRAKKKAILSVVSTNNAVHDCLERGVIDNSALSDLDGSLDLHAEETVGILFSLDRGCTDATDGAWVDFFHASMRELLGDSISDNGAGWAPHVDALEAEVKSEEPPRLETLNMLASLCENTDRLERDFQKLVHDSFIKVHSHHRILSVEDVERIDRVIGWSRKHDTRRPEAEFLFHINDALDKTATDPAWQKLFVEAISAHILQDPNSPGQVDFTEAEWLIRCIEGDGSFDVNEKALLDHLDRVSPRGQNLSDLVASVSEMLRAQEDTYLKTISTLVRALEAKDRYTAQHSSRVAHFAYKLGERVGLSEKMLRKLRYGSIMHDLGKIGVPDGILKKPAGLDNDEYHTIKRHPIDTVKIMKPLEDLKDFMDIAQSHHERWDGKGYPDGLKGTEIPLLSRIVSIADTWDSMVGDRVYRKAIPRDKAFKILEDEQDSGQWDPDLMREFLSMLRDTDLQP